MVDGDAAAAAARQGSAPAALLHREAHHARRARGVVRVVREARAVVVLRRIDEAERQGFSPRVGPDELEEERGRVLARGPRQLVDERADREPVVDGVHAAVPADARVRDGRARLDAQVGHVPRDVARAVDEVVGGGPSTPGANVAPMAG